jgi:hypothetical protein
MTFPDMIEADITKEDISCGIPDSCSMCPIARSVGRQFPGATVTVGKHLVVDYNPDDILTRQMDRAAVYPVPFTAQAFMRAFDAGERVTPTVLVFSRRRDDQ